MTREENFLVQAVEVAPFSGAGEGKKISAKEAWKLLEEYEKKIETDEFRIAELKKAIVALSENGRQSGEASMQIYRVQREIERLRSKIEKMASVVNCFKRPIQERVKIGGWLFVRWLTA